MALPTQTRQYQLAVKPTHNIDSSTFKLVTTQLPATLPPATLLLKNLYVSNDPAQRGWIDADADPARLYVPPVAIGEVMRARAIAEVIAVSDSGEGSFKKGDLVQATTGWTEYAVLPTKECMPLRPLPAGVSSPSVFLGALGATGLTAYYGLVEVAGAKASDVVVVSGAAGATGSMVVQIAKGMVGCKRVIGIAGGKEKCAWVESFLGADKCLDYKSSSFADDLKAATEGGVDVFFDNVGGETLDAMLACMNRHGRIAVCGAISSYNSPEPTVLKNWFEVIINRLELKGFIVLDYLHKAGEAMGKMAQAAGEGKIKVGSEMEMVVETGLEGMPEVWKKLFSGENRGKLVTKLV